MLCGDARRPPINNDWHRSRTSRTDGRSPQPGPHSTTTTQDKHQKQQQIAWRTAVGGHNLSVSSNQPDQFIARFKQTHSTHIDIESTASPWRGRYTAAENG